MSHVDDGQLNALLDGELSPDARRTVEEHLAACAECAGRLNEARAFLTQAGELLTALTPPPRAAEAPAAAGIPSVKRTAKEVAVSVDGRTELTPAIRPIFPHEVAAPRRRWQMPDLEKLAWAASLVLCIGVGYLANEVYHLRQQGRTAGAAPATDLAANSATRAESVAATAARPAGSRAARDVADERTDRLARSERSTALAAGPAEGRRSAAPAARRPAAKPPASKPAPSFARPRPEQIATNEPAAPPAAALRPGRVGATTAPAAPAPSAPAATAPPTAGALSDLAAGAGLASRSNAGAARAAEADAAPSSLDALTAFRRVTMEEGVRRLSGNIRLIDGMNPLRVEAGPGRLVAGADPDRDVVRVIYGTGTRRLVLDQQLGGTGQASFNGVMPGDTLVTALGPNGNQVRWVDRKFWLSLTGAMSADSVRSLVDRIR